MFIVSQPSYLYYFFILLIRPRTKNYEEKTNRIQRKRSNKIHQSGVLIYSENSVFFSFQSPKPTNQISLISKYRQDKLGLRRFFTDGTQTPDWCIVSAVYEAVQIFCSFHVSYLIVARYGHFSSLICYSKVWAIEGANLSNYCEGRIEYSTYLRTE